MSMNDRTLESLVIEILERVARIEAKLANGLTHDLEDHERRIRYLERGFWVALGALLILQVALKFMPPLPWQ